MTTTETIIMAVFFTLACAGCIYEVVMLFGDLFRKE